MAELTDLKCRAAKPRAKPYRLFDGGGLYLEVAPSGGKWWRLKYRIGGKEKRISLGVYGDVSLKAARAKRDEQRKVLATGGDPSTVKKAQRIAAVVGANDSFEIVAREWLKKFAERWTEDYCDEILRRLELNVFPWLGQKRLREISAPELLATLTRIEERGANETAHRVRKICSQVFHYGMATGRTDRDPAADLRGALKPVTSTHLAALTKPEDVAKLLRAIEGYVGSLVTRSALRLSPLVFVRPGELRLAPWTEFDLDNAEWNIPAERMKMGVAHLVPLSTQAVEILRELRPLTSRGRYVFPGVRSFDRPMSNNTINAALRGMGYTKDEMTGHGFRATARTILDEVLGFRPDFIEHQLAHQVRDPNGRAYNRTAYLPERRVMMQRWADYLDELRNSSAGRAS